MPTVADMAQPSTSGPYAGMNADQILAYMRMHGWTQDGVNALYAMRGLSNPPTVPASINGVAITRGRGGMPVGADGKPLTGHASDLSFLDTVTQQADDPFRQRSGISNFAGGALNLVGSYVGGPVWQAFTGLADAGNRALGNNDGTSYTDGQRSGADRAGAVIGAVAGSMNGPGSYGANNPAPTTGGNVRGISEGGAMGGSGSGGSGGFGTTSGSGGWLDTLINVGGDLLGSYLAGDAAHDAGRTQAAAAAAAIAEERRQYDQNREDLAPYRNAGGTAIGQLSAGTVDGGDFNRDFTMADFTKDPGYQFRMDEGSRALQGANAATLGVQNGRTERELERYGQDYASGEYSNAYNRFNADRNTRFNRLASIAGVGQTATNTGITSGNAITGSVADLTLDRANAQAAGRVGQANAYGQGLESLANFYRTRKYGSPNTNWIGG